MEPDLTKFRWNWHWRKERGEDPDCGIFAMVREGHAYAVARCPRYMTKEDWAKYAHHICTLHNTALDENERVQRLGALT